MLNFNLRPTPTHNPLNEINTLRDTIITDLDFYQSRDFRTQLESSSSAEALRIRIESRCQEMRESINQGIDRVQQAFVDAVPETPEERKEYEENILSPFELAMDSISSLALTVLESIKEFFVGLWQGIKDGCVWVVDKVKMAVSEAKNAFVEGFSMIRSWFQ